MSRRRRPEVVEPAAEPGALPPDEWEAYVIEQRHRRLAGMPWDRSARMLNERRVPGVMEPDAAGFGTRRGDAP